jgi:hypothetical protein
MSMSKQNPSRNRRPSPPSLAGIHMADATLIALREAVSMGQLDPTGMNAGKQYSRKNTNNLVTNYGHRAREILMMRHTPEFLKSRYGRQMFESWQNVPLREVVYAMSTAHPNCLRAFRVFKQGIVEWVGDDSHRVKQDAGDSTNTSDNDESQDTNVSPVAPPNISNGQKTKGEPIDNVGSWADEATNATIEAAIKSAIMGS